MDVKSNSLTFKGNVGKLGQIPRRIEEMVPALEAKIKPKEIPDVFISGERCKCGMHDNITMKTKIGDVDHEETLPEPLLEGKNGLVDFYEAMQELAKDPVRIITIGIIRLF